MAIWNDRIRQLRKSRDITLKAVAEYIGSTEATAQRYESGNGIKNIPYDVIVKYSELFNCSPAYLMGWEEKNNTPAYQQGAEEADVIKKYSLLSPANKKAVLTLIDNLLSAQEK